MNNKEKYEDNKMKVMDDVDYFKAQLDILFDEIEQIKITVNKIAGINEAKEEDEPEKEELTADNIPDFIDHLSNDILPKEEEKEESEEVDEELESVKESIREADYPVTNAGNDLADIFNKFDKILDDIEFKTDDGSLYEDIDDNATARSIVHEELINWGFFPETDTKCKSILYVIDCYDGCNVSKDDSIDTVDKKVNLSYLGWLNDALTYIRKKAEFKNTKYLTILGKMDRKDITNEIILKQILELCED